MLRHSWKEAEQKMVKVEQDSGKSMEIWFRVFHDKVTDDTYTVPIEELWHLVAACDKYDFGRTKLEKWFENWYKHQEDAEYPEERQQELLYPCWIFDHAYGFKLAAMSLAYGFVGHIMEKNPTEHYELHLPARIIQQMNAARGRLRTILERDLSNIADPLLEQDDCACADKTFRGYYKALRKIRVWPFGVVTRRDSINMILYKLERFDYMAAEDACAICRRNYNQLVDRARIRVRDYFDGLCLDCLNESKAKTRDRDTDYWYHNDPGMKWDDHCRFEHGQPTWYFSFMDRWEKQTIR